MKLIGHIAKKAFHLVRRGPPPHFEVRILHRNWCVPVHSPNSFPKAGIFKWCRRALDSLFAPDIVAVGLVKIFLLEYPTREWAWEIHLIVCGAQKDKLESAYGNGPSGQPAGANVVVREIKDLKKTAKSVFATRLISREYPMEFASKRKITKKSERQAYASWRSMYPLRSRVLRYGCDRYFKKLRKKPRTMRPTRNNGHPYPKWLEPYMFGTHEMTCSCIRCKGEYPLG